MTDGPPPPPPPVPPGALSFDDCRQLLRDLDIPQSEAAFQTSLRDFVRRLPTGRDRE